MTNPKTFHGPAIYRIRLKGHLDPQWSDWFEHLTICPEGDDTILTGSIADQAALQGLLTRIGDLNLTLLSVEHIEMIHSHKLKSEKEER